MDKEEKFLSKAKEMTSDYEVIKSFSIEDKIKEILKKESVSTHKERYKDSSFQFFHQDFTGFLSILLFAVGLLIAYYFVYIGRISLGEASEAMLGASFSIKAKIKSM